MNARPPYDHLAVHYAPVRSTDARIGERIHAALGNVERVLNVGAGTGSYEPHGRLVLAVEPSMEMIRRRPTGAAPVIQASAENLPFRSRTFDAAMAVLTMQHWRSVAEGLQEIRRVARRRVVIVTMDVERLAAMWLFKDYLTEAIAEHEACFPPLASLQKQLPGARIETLPVPRNCTDGFVAAFWARPAAYLDPRVRAASFLDREAFRPIAMRAVNQLRHDLDDGTWSRRYGHLLDLEEYDVGLRLVTGEIS